MMITINGRVYETDRIKITMPGGETVEVTEDRIYVKEDPEADEVILGTRVVLGLEP